MSTEATFTFDPFTLEARTDPYPMFRALRDEHPLYRNEERDFWAISRHEDCRRIARDAVRFSNEGGVDLDATFEEYGPGVVLVLDGERHDLLRRLIQPWFGGPRLGELAALSEELAHAYLDRIVEAGGGDMAGDVALPLYIAVSGQLMGVPSEDGAQLETWMRDFAFRQIELPYVPAVAKAASTELYAYFDGLVAQRSRRPGDDLLSHIASAARSGEITHEEAIGLTFFLWTSGVDTPWEFLTNALVVLARHPEARAQLRSNPQILADGIEELLRFDSPSQNTLRTTTCEIELHGHPLPVGSRLVLLWGSANRDERWIDRPDVFDITRGRTRHLTFGEGGHRCIAAAVMRHSIRGSLGACLDRLGNYELAGPGEFVLRQNSRGYMSLPVGI